MVKHTAFVLLLQASRSQAIWRPLDLKLFGRSVCVLLVGGVTIHNNSCGHTVYNYCLDTCFQVMSRCDRHDNYMYEVYSSTYMYMYVYLNCSCTFLLVTQRRVPPPPSHSHTHTHAHTHTCTHTHTHTHAHTRTHTHTHARTLTHTHQVRHQYHGCRARHLTVSKGCL